MCLRKASRVRMGRAKPGKRTGANIRKERESAYCRAVLQSRIERWKLFFEVFGDFIFFRGFACTGEGLIHGNFSREKRSLEKMETESHFRARSRSISNHYHGRINFSKKNSGRKISPRKYPVSIREMRRGPHFGAARSPSYLTVVISSFRSSGASSILEFWSRSFFFLFPKLELLTDHKESGIS